MDLPSLRRRSQRNRKDLYSLSATKDHRSWNDMAEMGALFQHGFRFDCKRHQCHHHLRPV